MNYKAEQKAINELIVHLSCYLHHNRTTEHMGNALSDVDSKYVENATFTLSMLQDVKSNAKNKIQKLLPVISEIMRHSGDIKGPEYKQFIDNKEKSTNYELTFEND